MKLIHWLLRADRMAWSPSRRNKPVDIPIFGSDQVVDVTGAGDTVIATFTAALAAGATAKRPRTRQFCRRNRRHEARYGHRHQQELLARWNRRRQSRVTIEMVPPTNSSTHISVEYSIERNILSRGAAGARRGMAARRRAHHAGQRLFRSVARGSRALSSCRPNLAGI